MNRWSRGVFSAAIAVLFNETAYGAALTRGPYLQSGTSSNVTVRWQTDTPTDSVVSIGTTVGSLGSRLHFAELRTEHEVKLGKLAPNTRYFYSIGSSDQTFASGPDCFFVTSPTNAKPTRIWVLGDSGTADSNAAAVRNGYLFYTGPRHTDLWLMLGDNAYGSGTQDEYTHAVFNMYPDMLRKSVLWPTIGNHDTYSNSQNPPYLDIFTLPTGGEAGGVPSGTERYYSFDYGNIHFVCLDSMNSDVSATGPMATWLREDLAANTNQWLIAFWHHPPYSKGSHDSDNELDLVAMRENFLPLLESYGVDLVLCGHSHSYERSFLMHGHYGSSPELDVKPWLFADRSGGPYIKDPAVLTNGTVYVVAGSSGQISGGDLDHRAMYVSLNELGSLVIDIEGNRLDASFVEASGFVTDQFTILKGDLRDLIRITTFRLTPSLVSLSWTSVPGQTYYVAFAPSLAAAWTPVSGSIPAQGHRTSWTGFRSGEPRGFYRVVRL